jgi:hypothetical protein
MWWPALMPASSVIFLAAKSRRATPIAATEVDVFGSDRSGRGRGNCAG